MLFAFYLAAAVAVIATALVVTRKNAVHALLYLVVSFLAVSVIFLLLGAPFVAALEVILYAGAIMVLFLFVIMMLAVGEEDAARERAWLSGGAWRGPTLLTLILAGELIWLLLRSEGPSLAGGPVEPRQVALALFGPYVIGAELAGMLLLAGLVGAFHLGRPHEKKKEGAS